MSLSVNSTECTQCNNKGYYYTNPPRLFHFCDKCKTTRKALKVFEYLKLCYADYKDIPMCDVGKGLVDEIKVILDVEPKMRNDIF